MVFRLFLVINLQFLGFPLCRIQVLHCRAATIDHGAHRAVRVDAGGASLAQWEEVAAPEGPPAELQLGWTSFVKPADGGLIVGYFVAE